MQIGAPIDDAVAAAPLDLSPNDEKAIGTLSAMLAGSQFVGFLLIIYPYIFTSAIMIITIGVVLSFVPYAHSRGLF